MDKDPNETPRPPRKVKYTPKKLKPRETKIQSRCGADEQNSVETQARVHRLNLEAPVARRETKVEKQSSLQVAFGPKGSSSPSLKTFSSGNSKTSGSKSKISANEKNGSTHYSTAIVDQSNTCVIDVADDDTTDSSDGKIKKDYKDPWDLNSNYPITLPLRKPYSGDPEILNEIEFGEAATNVEYDDKTLDSAKELGLLDSNEQHRMLFFKLPVVLPFIKGEEKSGTSKVAANTKKGTNLLELPGGYMGKMLVYKSGAVKIKLGETLFDVSPGTKSICAQDVIAMNTAQKHCCNLGTVDAKVVVTPDFGSIELEDR
ncbi:uncharacterized protein [Cicer arietinum]|uniref:Uncharacterized protein LOC101505757 isoform X2 n=1 Tax=Cicer arietinum TaxID=3827 RepID=A0A1S2Z3R9_CICAR|nr:uncharacterized protein LOC101505757 isoform X2 [Cicer arietinum]